MIDSQPTSRSYLGFVSTRQFDKQARGNQNSFKRVNGDWLGKVRPDVHSRRPGSCVLGQGISGSIYDPDMNGRHADKDRRPIQMIKLIIFSATTLSHKRPLLLLFR